MNPETSIQEVAARDMATREVEPLEARALAVRVVDGASLEAATGCLVELRRAENALETKRTEITGPMNASLRRVNDLFRPFSARVDAARRFVDGQIRDWRAAEAKRVADDIRWAEEKRAAAIAEVAAIPEDADDFMRSGAEEQAASAAIVVAAARSEAALPPATVAAAGGRVTARKRWIFEVVDAALVPREWMCVDEKRIGREVRAGAVRAIPGVRIWEEESLAVGT